ncbi:MAG: CDP-alcohol phosphatidyltransferase family protein [Eubacteriaceae bacterium]|nr:CDP-alcohol phosphatidyltransferase family protein [Eubacteriaceae bacterium]
MIGYYNYTVILTYIGMLTGFAGIAFAHSGDIYSAILCLMGAGVCDMFDGKIASTKKDRTREEKLFGIQIDSMSDLICFGVLPSLIVYCAFPFSILRSAVCMLYTLCALIRLSAFNVDETLRQREQDGERKIYTGLPVTTSALIFPTLYGLLTVLGQSSGTPATAVTALTAAAFLMPFRLKKPGNTGKAVLLILGLGSLYLIYLAGGLR